MRKIRTVFQAAGLALGLAATSIAMATPASAAPDVVSDCQNGSSDRCYFQPYAVEWDAKGTWDLGASAFETSTYTGAQENPGGARVVNCTGVAGSYTFATAVTKTDTITNGVTATVTGGLRVIFEASFSYAWSQAYSTAKEERKTFTVAIEPGHVGWITVAPTFQRRSGYLWSNYGSRVDGHYAWAMPVTEEGYIYGNYYLNSAQASADELAQCGVNPMQTLSDVSDGSGIQAFGGKDARADQAADSLSGDGRPVTSRAIEETTPTGGN